ncbi:unnamed protein product [Paramecium sonneborni]|uniref:Uncharacterized protein n=1 Tax=Paramecium sonneborni TaxID=65129 RepID=A0A8S1PHS4_9CILI|nr:unnamed protein product [Paramecium sonneborni]
MMNQMKINIINQNKKMKKKIKFLVNQQKVEQLEKKNILIFQRFILKAQFNVLNLFWELYLIQHHI